MSMKHTGTILLALLSVILSFSLLPAGSSEPEGHSGKEASDDWLMNPGYSFSVRDSSAISPSVDLKKYKKVAVLAFPEDPMGSAILDCMTKELRVKGYETVEQQTAKAILQEQGVQQQGSLDQARAAKIGQHLGADTVFLVHVDKTPEGRPEFSIKMLDVKASTVLGWAKFKATAVGHPVYARGFLCQPIPQWLETLLSPRTIKVALMDFGNKSGPSPGSQWDFLKREKGPYSSDPFANGLGEQLAQALVQTERFAVTDRPALEEEEKALKEYEERMARQGVQFCCLGTGVQFLIFADLTLHGDYVTIEVRLVDPHTKKLIKVTTVEGRPEDLSQSIGELFGGRLRPVTSREEDPAEKAVRAAIIKAATWIGENALGWIVVEAEAANVKEYPSIQSATLSTVRRGTPLKTVGEERDWIKVKLDSGETGWIYGGQVE